MCLYVLSSVLLISLGFFCCPVICLYVLSSVLLISYVFVVLPCLVSWWCEFRVAHFFSLFCVVLLCVFMFWVRGVFCCPLRCLYLLSSVLFISVGFFVLSCYVSLCSEFRVAHFLSFCCFALFVSWFCEFCVAHFFSLFCVVLICGFMFWVPWDVFVFLLGVFMFFVPCCSFLLFFCVVLLCVFIFWVPCCSFLKVFCVVL